MGKAILTFGRKARPLKTDIQRSFSAEVLDMQHVAQYKAFIGFPGDSNSPPLTYFYLLAQRAQLAIMLEPEFSFPVPGMVHVENDLRLLGALVPALPFEIDVQAIQEAPSQSGKLHVVLKVLIKQAGVERIACISRYLAHRERGRSGQPTREQSQEANREPVTSWSFPADIGRRYAELSGDYNPIHLWPWSARMLGFGKPIAHGMYAVAKAHAALEAAGAGTITQMSARFMKPVALPAEVVLTRNADSYSIESAGEKAVSGRFEVRHDRVPICS